jgi:hypothetical protein
MIRTIRIDHMLRETVRTPYADLVTRPTGAAVRNRIRLVLSDAPCHAACLDFSDVGLVDFSCADEVIAKLILDLPAEGAPYVLLLGVSDAQREAIDHVLAWHSLAVAEVPSRGAPPAVLGRINPDARRAFERVSETGPGDSGRLAAALGWTVERAADALQTLALLRLVQAGGGTYSPLPLPA